MSRRLLVTVLAAVALGACAYLGAVEPYRPPASYGAPPAGLAGAELGRFLYARDCAFCHGDQGQGTDRAPTLLAGTNGAALTDFMLRTGRMPLNDEEEPVRRRTPVYDDEEFEAVVTYIVSHTRPPGPEIPEIDPEAGDLATGQEIYQLNCAACHGTTGVGGAALTRPPGQADDEATGIIIPGVHEATLREVAEAVRTGPGTMPVFGSGELSDEDLNSLLRYVDMLRHPPDRGGFGLGHIGPFSEGAAGWLIGLGPLLLFIYWVGTKRGEAP